MLDNAQQLQLADRLKLRETLAVKLELYRSWIEQLGRERMILWELQISNELEIKKMQKEGRAE